MNSTLTRSSRGRRMNFERNQARSSHNTSIRASSATTRSANISASRNPLEQIRKAVFKLVSVRIEGRIVQVPVIQAYFRHLTVEAARGSTSANREQLWLLNYLDRKGILKKPEDLAPTSGIALREYLHEQKRQGMQRVMIRMFLDIRPIFKGHFAAVYGELPNFNSILPKEIDREIFEREKKSRGNFFVRSDVREDFDVGYGKPPVATRWPKGRSGNPTGAKKPIDDAWEGFRTGLLKTISVTTNGVEEKTTTVAVACTQLFQQAISGIPQARRLVREMIILLDEKGLLEAPRPIRRRRRPKPSDPGTCDEVEILLARAAFSSVHDHIKDVMVKAYTAAYGPVPEFEVISRWSISAEHKQRLAELQAAGQ